MFACLAKARVAAAIGDEVLVDEARDESYSLVEGASWEVGAGPSGISALSLESGSLELLVLPAVGEAFTVAIWLQLPLEREASERPLVLCGDVDAVDERRPDAVICADENGELGCRSGGVFHGCGTFVDDVGPGWYWVTAASTLGHGTRFAVNGKHCGDAAGRVRAGAVVRALGDGARPWGGLVADFRLFARGLGADDHEINGVFLGEGRNRAANGRERA